MNSIAALPTELWLLIFNYAVFDITLPGGVEEIVNTLLTITGVNASWRQLAISDPLLWTKICVAHTSPDSHSLHISSAQFDRIATFLERSKSAPLRLWLTRVEIPATLEKTEIDALNAEWISLFDLLKPHMNRCRKLWVYNAASNPSSMLPNLSDLLNTPDFPHLEEFFFSNSTLLAADQGVVDLSWNVCPTHTPLKTLRFTDWNHYLPLSFDAAWPELTSLELSLDHSRWPKLCRTLARLPLLQDLRLRFKMGGEIDLSSDSSLSISPARVTLPNLTSMSTNYLPAWLDISTPNLSRLTFISLFSYGPSFDSGMVADSPAFLRSMAELGSSVRELEFNFSAIQPQIILPMLQELYGIETLIFNDCYSLQGVISHLAGTRNQASDPCLPNLPQAFTSGATFKRQPQEVKFLPSLRRLRLAGRTAVPDRASVQTLMDSLSISSPDISVDWNV
ncbi:hypothetical protein DL93DRAFT_2167396 [Clavulina sp. PMI_390]|nr:hypothetical protein DL93DRAFT_2167396 [Clavulina sp. PMI_390]